MRNVHLTDIPLIFKISQVRSSKLNLAATMIKQLRNNGSTFFPFFSYRSNKAIGHFKSHLYWKTESPLTDGDRIILPVLISSTTFAGPFLPTSKTEGSPQSSKLISE